MAESPPTAARSSLTRNVIWSALAQGWSLALSFVSVAIVARFVPPSEYAVAALVTPLIAISQQIQSLGFLAAIVQARQISQSQLSTLFWCIVALSALLTATLILGAPQVAQWFGNPRVEPALTVGAAATIIAALAINQQALLVREMRFKAIALRTMGAGLAGTVVSIAVAWKTGSFWALIAGMLTVHAVGLAISYAQARWRPGLPGPLAESRDILRFGLSLWSANLFTMVSRHVDNLIVGANATPRELGLYDRSYQVLVHPLNQAVAPLGLVLFPTLSRSQDEPARYREHYWRAVAVVLPALLPGLAVAAVNSTTLVGLLLGPMWLEAGPLFVWFTLGAMVQSYVTTLDWLLTSQGRGADLLRKNIFISAIALLSFLIGIRWGIEGVAAAYVLGQTLICAPIALWWTGRKGPVNLADMLRSLAPHALATATLLAVTLGLRTLLGSPLWPQLIVMTIAAYLTYLAVILAVPSSRARLLSVVGRISEGIAKSLGTAT